MSNEFVSVEVAIETLKAGKLIILLDDEDRENEGDLVAAADKVTKDTINFMITHGRGLVCLPMSPEWIDRLHLPMMTYNNRSPYGTAFTISIEAAKGVGTGISAEDRAKTIAVAIDPKSKPQDLVSPGHIFPLRASPHGVLSRRGQTEGSVDLVKLAGLTPAAVICEVLNEDGSMSRREQLSVFSKKHHIPMLTIQALVDYRIQHESWVNASATTRIPMKDHGDFEMTVFDCPFENAEHFALVKAPFSSTEAPLVRLHCECLTGDVFHSMRCDCGEQLDTALAMLSESGGVLIYLRQEGRGIGLSNKLKAYALQETQGLDTVEANLKLGLAADQRDYAFAHQILKYLGINAMKLITNNPSKVQALTKYGLNIVERIPIEAGINHENKNYLSTKKHKFGHYLSVD